MNQNARFNTTRELNKVDTYNDVATLKNVLEFSQALHDLFVELKEENWVVGEADKITGACLEKLIITPGVSTDDLITYYGKMIYDGVRMVAINNWRGNIKNLNTPEALLDYVRVFKFALADSAGKEAYVKNNAVAGIDEIYFKLLTTTDPTIENAKIYYHAITGDQSAHDAIGAISARITAASATDAQIVYLAQLLEVIIDDSATRGLDMVGFAKNALGTASLALVASPTTSIEDKKTYFHKIQSDQGRREAMDALGKTIAPVLSKDALVALRGFYKFAAEDSSKSEAWLPEMARNWADTISVRLLTDYALSSEEATYAFHEMRSDQIYSDLIVALSKRADDLAETDAALPRLGQLFEIAIAQSTGHPDWVVNRGHGALDSLAKKIALAKDSTVDTRMAYFHKISGSNDRRIVIEALTKQVDDLKDRAALIDINRFFIYAAADSASFEAWLSEFARRGADAISLRLFNGYELSLDEMKTYFHQIASDQTRRDLPLELRKRIPGIQDKAKLSELNQLFLFAIQDSAARPGWIAEAAAGGADECSSAALLRFELTDEEAQAYVRQIQSDSSGWSILRALVKKMEKNRDSYEALLQLRGIFDVAVQELGTRSGEKWDQLRGSFFGALENASARIIRKPVVDADEMIAMFHTLRSDELRKDVINYWRGKIGHNYNDKTSLLALAKFFNAAKRDVIATGNIDWVIGAAENATREISVKIGSLFPVYEGVFEIESTCPDHTCATGFLDTMVILNSLTTYDGLQVNFMHGDTGTPAFTFSAVTTSMGGTTFDGMIEAGGLSKMHLEYDVVTGSVTGWIKNSDRGGQIQLTGRQRHSPVDVYDEQAAYVTNDKPTFPTALPEIKAKGTFDTMAATLSVRNLTANGITVFGGLLKFDAYPKLKVNFQQGSYNSKSGMLVLVSTQPSGSRMKLILGTKFDPVTGEVSLTGTSFSSSSQKFHDMQFNQ